MPKTQRDKNLSSITLTDLKEYFIDDKIHWKQKAFNQFILLVV